MVCIIIQGCRDPFPRMLDSRREIHHYHCVQRIDNDPSHTALDHIFAFLRHWMVLVHTPGIFLVSVPAYNKGLLDSLSSLFPVYHGSIRAAPLQPGPCTAALLRCVLFGILGAP